MSQSALSNYKRIFLFQRDEYCFVLKFSSRTVKERKHVLIETATTEAKFWLLPSVRVAHAGAFNRRTLHRLVELVQSERERIIRLWSEHVESQEAEETTASPVVSDRSVAAAA